MGAESRPQLSELGLVVAWWWFGFFFWWAGGGLHICVLVSRYSSLEDIRISLSSHYLASRKAVWFLAGGRHFSQQFQAQLQVRCACGPHHCLPELLSP